MDADTPGGTPFACSAWRDYGNPFTDDRGNLTLQLYCLPMQSTIFDALLEESPARILWENVPASLSTNDNAFGASWEAWSDVQPHPLEPRTDGPARGYG